MRKYALLLAAIPLLFIAGEVGAAGEQWISNPQIYRSKLTVVSGGEIQVNSGGTFDHQSGATFVAHGLTISAAEMGSIDGVTLGASLNSKVWSFSSTGKATLASGDSLDLASGSKWLIAGTAVGASATEIDYNDITTLGSSQNSKALTVAATGEATIVSGDSVTFASGAILNHASGATLNLHGSAWTSTEFGLVDGITAGASLDSKALVLGATGLLNGGRPTIAFSDTAGPITLAAGKVVFTGVAGITLTPISIVIEVVGDSIETATSVVLNTTADSPIAVATISGAALNCASGTTVSAGATSATLVYGAGYNVAGTVAKGFRLDDAGGTAASDTGYVRATIICTFDQ